MDINSILRRALLPCLLALLATGCDEPRPMTQHQLAAAQGKYGASTAFPDFTRMVERQGPAVVSIETVGRAPAPGEGQDRAQEEFFRHFVPGMPSEPAPGVAAGFILTEDGYILTNAHVVAGAAEILVHLADQKRSFKATVVGVDTATDIALLKVDASALPVASIGTSSSLKVGEWVAAIGSPFGFDNTITVGIVSALGRSLPDETLVPFIQTDVAINPGSSGGPLLNLRGEVVGINSQIYSRTGGYMGVSFAVPIDTALQVSRQLRDQGEVTRGRLGVAFQAMSADLARSFRLPGGSAGALVTETEPDGPAAQAGLKPGDVILKYNGKAVSEARLLPLWIAESRPGSRVTLDIWREAAPWQLVADIAQVASPSPSVAAAATPASAPPSPDKLGVVLSELPPSVCQQLGLKFGLLVESVEALPANVETQDKRLRPGDIIVLVNDSPFSTVEEFHRLLKAAAATEAAALLVRRGPRTLYSPLRLAHEQY